MLIKDCIIRLQSLSAEKKRKLKIIFFIFSALGTAFLYLLYYLYLFYNLKNKGELIYPLRTEGFTGLQSELTMFAVRVREMIDGYWHISDSGFYEHRNAPLHLNEALPAAVYYFLYLLVGFKYLFVIGDFLLIAASFILIFYLVYLLTRRYYISLFFTFMFLMIKDFIFLLFPGFRPLANLNDLKEIAKALSPFILDDWHTPRRLDFVVSLSTRPGFLFFIPALIFLFLFIKNKNNYHTALLGICYGLLFYAYPFYWMYLTIVFGILGATYFLKKNFAQLKRLAVSGAIAGLISIFYWMNQFKLRMLPHFQDIVNNIYVIQYGREFQRSYWFWYLFSAFLVILIYYYAKEKNKMYLVYYFAPLILAGFIGFNMQVITGFNFSSPSWYTRVSFVPMFFAIAVLFTWFFEKVEKKSSPARNIIVVLMVWLAVFQITGSIQGQAVLASNRVKEHLLPKRIGESLMWIDKNLPKDSVILALDTETNYYLQLYTPARVMIQYPYNDTVPQKERDERLYIAYKFFGIAPQNFEKKFEDPVLQNIYGQLFAPMYIAEGDIEEKRRVWKIDSDRKKRDIISGYKNYQFNLAQALTKYKIDYIFYQPADKELTDIDFDKLKYLEKIYERERVKIYKLNAEKI